MFHLPALGMAPQEKTGVVRQESGAKPWPCPGDALAATGEVAMEQTRAEDAGMGSQGCPDRPSTLLLELCKNDWLQSFGGKKQTVAPAR